MARQEDNRIQAEEAVVMAAQQNTTAREMASSSCKEIGEEKGLLKSLPLAHGHRLWPPSSHRWGAAQRSQE